MDMAFQAKTLPKTWLAKLVYHHLSLDNNYYGIHAAHAMVTRLALFLTRESGYKVNIHVIILNTVKSTVKPLKSGHIGGRTLVRCGEVVPISEVD